MKADTQAEAAVMAVLEQFRQAYTQRDIQRALPLFSPDPDVVLLGTGADEKCVGLGEIQRQFERDWAQSESLAVEWGSGSSVSAAGTVAWVVLPEALVSVTAGGQAMELPLRLSAVLEQRGGRWFFMHVHFSFPAAGEAEGESFPAPPPR
jgi:ketosteroid isomerase-like protein